MKVIAKASEGNYICAVTHEELEKFLNQYYGNLAKLSVGQEVNLGQGYNFAARIERACSQMADAMKSFNDARATMTAYALAIASQPAAERKPLHIEAIHLWAAQRAAALGPDGVTDAVAFLEEGVRWGETQHGINSQEGGA